jgi:hypothetical protein
MDDKTAELRDIFIDTTGSETVTESQEEMRGSLTEDERKVERRVLELIGTMRERYEFTSGLGDDDLHRVVTGFYDEETDGDIAGELGVDPDVVVAARMDLHLVRDEDRDAPFDIEKLRRLVVEEATLEECAAKLGTDESSVEPFVTRANDRFRDEFEELLTDSDLSARLARNAREDGLKDATEDIETDVSF